MARAVPPPLPTAASGNRPAAGSIPVETPPGTSPAWNPWRALKDFSALGGNATYLWPRWLVLRAVGLVYIFIFAGIIVESRAMIGPDGVAPLASFLEEIRKLFPGSFPSFLAAPSLFWLGTGTGMITALAWGGLAAAVAVVLNWWPRVTLGICWAVFLSFVATWADFSSAQLDRLMLETALLCIPFAPSGFRPGLGAASPPRPIAVFTLRWLLFRVMFESGLVKLLSDDPHWRNLTAMDVMYETAPSPTILGYWAHQLPHAFHVVEIALTFAAELLAPLLAVFGGRRGRWWALAIWTAFQAGIQLTCNFGWLNTAAMGLGLLLLDDQMVATAAGRLRLAASGRFLATPAPSAPVRTAGPWRFHGLRLALGAHFFLTLFYFAKVCGLPVTAAPRFVTALPDATVAFASANGYSLYASFVPGHPQVDFEGSNDGGKTWRTYEYRHVPQSVDRVAPFLAPWFPRFEATIQIESWSPGETSLLPIVAARLLARNPDVMNRFARDPFPERPPTVVRMRRYRLVFTDRETQRRTGHYWRKEFAGNFLPAVYVTEQGEIAQFSLAEATAALAAGNLPTALAIYERQFQLGNLDAAYRLADIYAQGRGVPAQPEKAVALLTELVTRGEVGALHNLGACYEYGFGVPADLAKAAALYRRATELGDLRSMYAVGKLAADDRLVPPDDVEGLSSLLRAAARTDDDSALLAVIHEEQPALAKRLMSRMSASQIAAAEARAVTLR